MEKEFEKLQLKDDFMFSIVMRNPKYCKPFLERILGVKISRIEYPKVQETIDIAANAKSVRLDIYVEDENETVYNAEMQTAKSMSLPKRSRYYQGMIDLNILEKGKSYKNLKKSFIIFICTFDLFDEGRHIYTFENRCLENLDLELGDETTKIFLNTKGTLDDVTPELRKLLDYLDGKEPCDVYTKELEKAVKSVRSNEKWRLDYMTLEMHYQEKYEQGLEQGLERGLEQGLERGTAKEIVETGYEFGMSKEDIIERIQKKLNISRKKAGEYFAMYEMKEQ